MNDDFTANRRLDDDAGKVVLIERSLVVLLVVGLFVGVLAIVKPFMTAILFGASLATATWPLRQALRRRGLGAGGAAAVLLISSIALVGLPLVVVAPNLADQLIVAVQRAQAYFAAAPAQPAWLAGLPVVGSHLVQVWDRLVEAEGDLRALATPYAANLEQTMIAAARALADSVVQVILSLIVATCSGSTARRSSQCCTPPCGASAA